MSEDVEHRGPWTGGCQCGAVRYRVARLGRSSICHCRMCQKATGGFFGPYVTAEAIEWTRGERKLFQSSNRARRGFCAECGTPLTFEPDIGSIDVSIGSFDRASEIAPQIEVGLEAKLPYFEHLHKLQPRPAEEMPAITAFQQTITSNQHPDHDTAVWPLVGEKKA